MADEASDRIGTDLLFENHRVRVWDMTLAPGESSELHKHSHDYLYVYVTDDNELRIEVPGGEPMLARAGAGSVSYWEVGPGTPPPHYTHRAINTGAKAHQQILVEFLGSSVGAAPSGPVSNGR